MRLRLPKRRGLLVWISSSHGWKTHVIEFFAVGTAVLPLEKEIAPEQIADPIMVLSVND